MQTAFFAQKHQCPRCMHVLCACVHSVFLKLTCQKKYFQLHFLSSFFLRLPLLETFRTGQWTLSERKIIIRVNFLHVFCRHFLCQLFRAGVKAVIIIPKKLFKNYFHVFSKIFCTVYPIHVSTFCMACLTFQQKPMHLAQKIAGPPFQPILYNCKTWQISLLRQKKVHDEEVLACYLAVFFY